MKRMHRPWIAVLLTIGAVLVAGLWWASGPTGAQPAAGVAPPAVPPLGAMAAAGAVPPLGAARPLDAVPAGIVSSSNTVTAAVNGAVGAGGPAEAVSFSGQASVSGKVIHDPDFGTSPILEIVIDLSKVSGTGQPSGKTYLVSTRAVLHRPLLAFDSIELSFPFSAAGGGITTTPVTITTNPG